MPAGQNPFAGVQGGLSSPGSDIVPVTPNDATDLPDGVCRALLIGAGGTLSIITAAGNTRAITVGAGLLPVGVARVRATGTTCTGIAAVY